MTRPPTYLMIEVRVSIRALQRESFLGATRDEREQHLKDYLETLGLRPRHGGGTLQWWDDPAVAYRQYRQTIPRSPEEAPHGD